MKKALLFLFISTIHVSISFSQTRFTFQKEYEFAQYLTENRVYEDALYLLNRLYKFDGYSTGQMDSLNFFLGWNYYLNNQMDSSSYFLSKVRYNSPFFNQSKFIHAYVLTHSGKYRDAEYELKNFHPLDSNVNELRNFELAGVYLLKREFNKFDSLAEGFTFHFLTSFEERNFIGYKEEYLKIKNKSPLVAGALSAIIPGSGKYYAGYKRQGFSTFLAVAAIGAVTAEAYIKGGARSIPFIASAGVFTIFYTGNIWGSILSVKIKRNERYREIDHLVNSDMHKPLQRLYR